jgi:hypothetical protein
MTVVEWILKKLFEEREDGQLLYQSEEDIVGLFEQAKEMEKQQIIDAHGNQTKKSPGISNYTYILTGEEYYNQTFKNK